LVAREAVQRLVDAGKSLRESNTYVSPGDLENVETRARTYALVADVSFGAAIVSAVVATSFTLRSEPKRSAKPDVRFFGQGTAGRV